MSGGGRSATGDWPLGAALVIVAGLTPMIGADDAVVAALRLVVVLGIAAGWLWWLARGHGASLSADRGLVAALLACTAAVVVSGVASPIPLDALLWSFGEGTSAAYWIGCLVILAGSATVVLDGRVRRALGAVAVVVMFLGIIGVLQRYSGIPAGETIAGGSNRLGPLCAMMAIAALGLAVVSETSAEAIGWRIGAALLGASAVLSGAATATLALFAGSSMVLLWHPALFGVPLGARRLTRAVTGAALGILVLAAIVATMPRMSTGPIDELVDAQIASESVVARLELWKMAGRMTVARPVTGWGPDGFEYGGQQFVTQDAMALIYDEAGVSFDPRTVLPQDPHSLVMTIASELGLVGIFSFAFLAAVWARRAWLHWKAAGEGGLRASLIIGALTMGIASLAVPTDAIGGVVGITIAGLAISQVESGQQRVRTRAWTGAAAAATVAAVVLGSSTLGGAAAVESAFSDATDARVLSHELQTATKLQPGSSMRAYQVLWADAYRVGVDLSSAEFVALYESPSASAVRGFAPYATELLTILVSRDRSPSTLAWARGEAESIVAAAPAYPESQMLKALIVARQGDTVAAWHALEAVSWASASARYQASAAEIAALAEGRSR